MSERSQKNKTVLRGQDIYRVCSDAVRVTDGFVGDTQRLVEENACAVIPAGLLGVGARKLCQREAGEDVLFSVISQHSLPPKQPVPCWILFSWVFVCFDSFHCLVFIFFDLFLLQ